MRSAAPTLTTSALLALLLAGGAGCDRGSNSGRRVVATVQGLARGPFLAEPTLTSMVIAWSTELPGIGSVVWSQGGGPTTVVAGTAPATAHALRIDGLAADTLYDYTVAVDGTPLHLGATFRTLRDASSPDLRFAVFGDSGTGGSAQAEVAAQVAAFAPELVLIAGDVVYPAGERSRFDPCFFRPYAGLIDHIPFFPALGNHDIKTANGERYLEAFHLPHDNPEQSERYYTVTAADALFVVLDSNQGFAAGSAQATWLADVLTTSATWKFAVFHHPPFSSGKHGSDLQIRSDLEALFTANGVDVVFNGHDHAYERSFPVVDGVPVQADQEPDYTTPAGPIWIVTGGGGKELYARASDNDFTARFVSTYHFVAVEFSGPQLTLSAIDASGATIDTLTIAK
ncbi:MAG: metallophosphoesterase family protein [Planctomycetes bacterium]|nr:metallophosphoesterase family protein [Planctomycetota bacterium]